MLLTFNTVEDDEEVYNIYWSAEQKCRKYTTAIVAVFILQILLFHAAVFFYSVYDICIGIFDASTWPTLYDLSVPFDATKIWGWYLLWLITLAVNASYILCLTSAVTYFVSCCFYLGALCDRYNFIMRSIEALVEKNQHENSTQMNKTNYRRIRDQVHKSIEIQIQIYQ